MFNWQYNNPVEIHFGPGIIKKLPGLVVPQKAVLITTPGFTRRGITGLLKKSLGNSLMGIIDTVLPNPTLESVKETFLNARQYKYDLIIAMGGGSTIDTAKALATIEASGTVEWIADHLKHKVPFPREFQPKPIIAIPTTAGTGSEVTMWGTIWDMVGGKKYSICHSLLYPSKAVLDPELTITLNEKETIYSGLDALSHAMESVWNKNHNPVSDTFALQAMSLVYSNLPELINDLTNLELRSTLLQASLLAGLAFSNTKTALAHAISYPLTALYGLPHGLACSLPLRLLLGFNGICNFDRVSLFAKILGAEPSLASMKEGIDGLFYKLGISMRLSDYGVSRKDAHEIYKAVLSSERTDNNIAQLDQSDLKALIDGLF